VAAFAFWRGSQAYSCPAALSSKQARRYFHDAMKILISTMDFILLYSNQFKIEITGHTK